MSDTITIGSSGRIAIALIGVALLVGLAGCAASTEDVDRPEGEVEYESTEVHTDTTRFIDREAGVVCYKYGTSVADSAGLSCVPIDQTDLGEA